MFDAEQEMFLIQKALESFSRHDTSYYSPVVSLFCRGRRIFLNLCATSTGALRDALAMVPAFGADGITIVTTTDQTETEKLHRGRPAAFLRLTQVNRGEDPTQLVCPYVIDHRGKLWWVQLPPLQPSPATGPVVDDATAMLAASRAGFSIPEGLAHLRRHGHRFWIGTEIDHLGVDDIDIDFDYGKASA